MRGYSTGTGFRLSLITGFCCSAAYTALHRHPGSMKNQAPCAPETASAHGDMKTTHKKKVIEQHEAFYTEEKDMEHSFLPAGHPVQ